MFSRPPWGSRTVVLSYWRDLSFEKLAKSRMKKKTVFEEFTSTSSSLVSKINREDPVDLAWLKSPFVFNVDLLDPMGTYCQHA